jgi:pyridoxamine 5'-phosphate oxidase
VLLKDVSDEGFTFFTNYGSNKARELDANPAAAVTFHWQPLRRQVCARGAVVRVSRDESAAYWATRPRGSQLGAWASRQSTELDSRDELEARLAELEARFEGGDVPLPEFWGGYRITPVMVEFWQGRANRLHDRFRYTREGGAWTLRRLSP